MVNITKDKKKQILSILNRYRTVSRSRPSRCYGWDGASRENITPKVNIDGKSIGINRAAWMAHYGRVPDYNYVLNTCKNKHCSNPNHLYISRDRARGNKTSETCSRREGRERISVDLPTELVYKIKIMAAKYHQTVTKYLFKRLSEVVEFENGLDRRDEQ